MGIVWFWVGSHTQYARLVASGPIRWTKWKSRTKGIARWAWLTSSVAGCVLRTLMLTLFSASLPSSGRPAAQDDSSQISLDIPDMSLLPGTGLRQMHTRPAAAGGCLLLVLLFPTSVPAQSALIAPQSGMGGLTVAAATPADLRSWDVTIDQSVRVGELVVSSVQEDPVLAWHRHETFIQSYWGIPVYGGSLVRQTADGVTVSVIGTLLTGITVDPTPTLSAARVAAILGEVSGASLVATSAPRLTVFRMFDGTGRLTYRATMTDMRTYFVDADTGQVVWSTAAVVTQRAVGLGTGAVGDHKKISATQAAGTFRSHDRFRPAPIRTYDTRGRLDVVAASCSAVSSSTATSRPMRTIRGPTRMWSMRTCTRAGRWITSTNSTPGAVSITATAPSPPSSTPHPSPNTTRSLPRRPSALARSGSSRMAAPTTASRSGPGRGGP